MLIHVLFRTHAGTNAKARPDWYSRELSLRSLRTSLEAMDCPSQLTVVSDGQLPPSLRPLMSSTDDVITVRGGSTAASMRRALEIAKGLAGKGPADTLFWFAEDDYVYQRHAMSALAGGARHLSAVDYFTLYSADGTGLYSSSSAHRGLELDPADRHHVTIDEVTWQRIRGTTSTFGVRRDALLKDSLLLLAGTFAEAPFDGATWHMLQGHHPYSWRHLLADTGASPTRRGVAKACIKPPLRATLNLMSSARASRPHLLFAPTIDLAMHMEIDAMPDSDTWREVAQDYDQ